MSTMTVPSLTAASAVVTDPTPLVPAGTRRLVLTGFMGVGKSTVGPLLAQRLGWTFLDLDIHIEERSGTTIPELFRRNGEPAFRRIESTALASALRRPETVLALGGGAPETLTNRLLLEQTPGTLVLFLDASFPTLFDRCMLQNVDRPVLADTATAQARFAQRQPMYRRLARHTIDTTDRTPQSVADAIFATIAPAHNR